MSKILFIGLFIICFGTVINAQNHKVIKTINWDEYDLAVPDKDIDNFAKQEGVYVTNEYFTGAEAKFNKVTFLPITENEKDIVAGLTLAANIFIDIVVAYERKKPVINYSFNPYRLNPETNLIEKVNEYEIYFTLKKKTLKAVDLQTYAANSLLNSGDWYKIKVDVSGVYRLTYSQLEAIGLSQPQNVRLYYYGGKQLPYANSDKNYDDLVEIPIKMVKGNDESFNAGDYIIFYAEGSTTWDYNAGLDMFVHSEHNFSNYTYMFISDFMGEGGLRIPETDNGNLNTDYTTTSFDSYKHHEENSNNLIQTGRTWYGEKFIPGGTENFPFAFPNIIGSEKAKVYTSVAGRKKLESETCYFSISDNNTELGNIEISDNYSKYVYARGYSRILEINNPSASINLEFEFVGVNSNMVGYLDFVCVNTREKLKMHGSQFMFRDKHASKKTTKFDIDNTGKSIIVWNITDATKPYEIKLNNQNGTSSFKIPADTLQQFIAFDGSNFLSPIIEGENLGLIENQNLHGAGFFDMVIITHPKFKEQADTLAELHRTHDNLSVLVTQPQIVYNEFSSGTIDISAIRNFMRMLYDKANTDNEMPKYLLLFGDGSYDNWNTGSENSNLIPTYQSINSLGSTTSYVSDDYYGLLSLGEGEIGVDSPSIYGLLDIGVGRFPVQTVEEAQLMVDKVRHYISPKSFGSWRTNICFIGDDDDNGMHMKDPEAIDRDIIKVLNPEYNVNKIYLDAYKQISTPSGQRYPDVTEAINRQVEYGALIIDYVGHGNPRILAHEHVLTVTDVRNWKNWDKLSIFVTASCEVGRFDDFERTSLGEWMILGANGGGIAALTTTRVVHSGTNDNLNRSFFRNVLRSELRLGDVIRIAKNEQPASGLNHRNFTLLGDPAIKLAVPENKIVVGAINNNFLPVNKPDNIMQTGSNTDKNPAATVMYEPGDTIYALSKATVEGYIDDKNGDPFNKDGVLYITVFDKTDTLRTYGQDNNPVTFTLQNKILYKGKASITNGYFKFEFIMPKDINYKFGKGKLSLYAVIDSTIEAIGYSDNIIIGGNAEDIESDFDGPEIALFMNDTLFMNGGTTDENPIFIAILKDTTGINTTGNGFGHNITATLDGNQDNVTILNNYYEGYIDKYNSGEVNYRFYNLEPGYHYINFKAWDIYNNSQESMIEFYVRERNEMVIENMYNRPNPFRDFTEFTFEHNQSFDAFDITINIFDIMGSKVAVLNQKNSNLGYAITPIQWDGTNSGGAKLPKGVYIYRTEITATDGKKTHKSSKLMIF